jgi:hypothetical protein
MFADSFGRARVIAPEVGYTRLFGGGDHEALLMSVRSWRTSQDHSGVLAEESGVTELW